MESGVVNFRQNLTILVLNRQLVTDGGGGGSAAAAEDLVEDREEGGEEGASCLHDFRQRSHGAKHPYPRSGPSSFDFAQHRQTLRPSVDGIRSKALRPFGLQ